MTQWEYLNLGLNESNFKEIDFYHPKDFDIKAFIGLLTEKPTRAAYNSSAGYTEMIFKTENEA